MSTLHTPVLLLVFNRLHTTQQVFEAIRQAQPPRLYIACDGPRPERLGEAAAVQAVRDYVMRHVDWHCQVETLFRAENLGCRVAVSTAIDWFFAQEPEGIILEDDCLPDASFFPYVEELLMRYRQDQRIMAIGGTHAHGDTHQPPHSYFFSRNIEVWGWASWRRAWQYYDRDLSQWPALRDTDWLLTIGDGNRNFQHYWQRVFDRTFAGENNTWDYQWLFSCWSQRGLTILPARNLVSNIGFGAEATHTTVNEETVSALRLESLSFPLSHPPTITKDYAADQWLDRNVDKITAYGELKAKLGRISILRSIWHRVRPRHIHPG